ncbi:MAG: 16S rRNA (guanine(527)-N(7))-methyltransferase RsmG [Bacteroidales bacterium]|nr:16S rRNA (guanine(527)-N(7))-methyltransferase RsmG [Bacteroidales bacterium]
MREQPGKILHEYQEKDETLPTEITCEKIFRYFPELTEEQKGQFRALGALYREWNSKINVISRKDIDQLYLHHVLHSMAIARYMIENGINARKIIDVGTGGGFPGIPLAITFPHIEFTLCDSISKKIKVVTEISNSIGLKNITPKWGRSEDLKGEYDFVVSRGVTTLKNFIPLVKHLYTKGIIYLKGGDIYSEALECSRMCHIPKENFRSSEISRWFEEEFFIEKYIVSIGDFDKFTL